MRLDVEPDAVLTDKHGTRVPDEDEHGIHRSPLYAWQAANGSIVSVLYDPGEFPKSLSAKKQLGALEILTGATSAPHQG